ncbi:YrzI family small protein [Falsibacillus pallidus]|uniref:Uncharacterized protein (TIGR02413 family) n=1 Tax=Falsibacillus pallidus TaxID=493781 RepID=A0A370GK84_9BACI|nr:YrzI family small protein [Falsibacillus pallidus]RDI44071.1 uncharacterized protein (TIGR02413 family) [Falsibacillus pallidus]
MTLNILFMTVTIKKRQKSLEEAVRDETVAQLYETNRDKHQTLINPYML